MSSVRLTVNGTAVVQDVEARTSLADLLREKLHLTGTHLGCEQGVCGACTVLVDGVPIRSCITSAIACSGAEVRTIESFDADPEMEALRKAFNTHHALQCGFCTPGMLITARDVVGRLNDVDEERIRLELSGNLCRCTGYAGIIKAVRSVAMARRAAGIVAAPRAPTGLGPAGSGHEGVAESEVPRMAARRQPDADPSPKARPAVLARIKSDAPSVKQSFVIDHSPDIIWTRFGDVPAMIRCIPGATLVGETEDGNFRINMRVKMGPIVAQFAGVANQERNEAKRFGTIRGSGRDERSASLANGEMSYAVSSANAGAAARVDIEIRYALTGALGQFARGGIVSHFVRAITAEFAENLRHSLSPDADKRRAGSSNELRLTGSLIVALKSWFRDLFGRLLSR